MNRQRTVAAITAAAFALSVTGCATKGTDFGASYVPNSVYEGASCKQLALDIVEMQEQAGKLSGQLDTAAGKDAALVAVGAILFWPALFFVGGDKGKEAELARLKGSHETMTKVYRTKKCEASS